MKDSFRNRLSKALSYNNMLAIDLVNKTGISKSLISGYMNGKYEAKQDKLCLIANTLNVNEAWLMGYDVPMEKENISKKIKDVIQKSLGSSGLSIEIIKQYVNYYKDNIQGLNSSFKIDNLEIYSHTFEELDLEIIADCGLDWVNKKIDNDETFSIKDILNDPNSKITMLMILDILDNLNYKRIENSLLLYKQKIYNCPVYGQISAGQPNWAEENLEGYLPLDPELMGIVDPEEHYFLRVNGESMNKVIQNGAFALIHKQDTVDNGEIAVVLVNGDNATLKRFSKQNDIIVLTPESTDDSFEQQIYTKETPIRIIGKYVGKMEFNK